MHSPRRLGRVGPPLNFVVRWARGNSVRYSIRGALINIFVAVLVYRAEVSARAPITAGALPNCN